MTARPLPVLIANTKEDVIAATQVNGIDWP
jgi:hypothetical protein